MAKVESPYKFKGMMWGQRTKIYTDHKNLIQDALGLTSDHVYRWRLILEEYGPKIVHIKGIQNIVADAFSRLDFTANQKLLQPSLTLVNGQSVREGYRRFEECKGGLRDIL